MKRIISILLIALTLTILAISLTGNVNCEEASTLSTYIRFGKVKKNGNKNKPIKKSITHKYIGKKSNKGRKGKRNNKKSLKKNHNKKRNNNKKRRIDTYGKKGRKNQRKGRKNRKNGKNFHKLNRKSGKKTKKVDFYKKKQISFNNFVNFEINYKQSLREIITK